MIYAPALVPLSLSGTGAKTGKVGEVWFTDHNIAWAGQAELFADSRSIKRALCGGRGVLK